MLVAVRTPDQSAPKVVARTLATIENCMNHASAIGLSRHISPLVPRHDPAASIDNVARSVRAALRNGVAVVWIGTDTGLRWLQARLSGLGADVAGARKNGRIVCLDVTRTLGEITVDALPDVVLFAERVGSRIDAIANLSARVMIVVEAATGDSSAAASVFQALLRSFVRSRTVFSYRACCVDACRCETTTQPGRNRWSVVDAGASLAMPIPFNPKTKERS